MAEAIPTTQASVTEALPFAQTPISSLFSRMLGALTAHLVAERGFDRLELVDDERMAWLHETASVQVRLERLLADLAGTACVSPLDAPLKRMTRVLAWLIVPEEFDVMPRSAPWDASAGSDDAELFCASGSGADAAGVAALIRRAERGIAMMAELPLYQDRVSRLGVMSMHLGLGSAGAPCGALAAA